MHGLIFKTSIYDWQDQPDNYIKNCCLTTNILWVPNLLLYSFSGITIQLSSVYISTPKTKSKTAPYAHLSLMRGDNMTSNQPSHLHWDLRFSFCDLSQTNRGTRSTSQCTANTQYPPSYQPVPTPSSHTTKTFLSQCTRRNPPTQLEPFRRGSNQSPYSPFTAT